MRAGAPQAAGGGKGRQPSPHRVVNPEGLAPPVGFAHAVVARGAVYLGGQTGEGASLVEQFDSAATKLVTALRAAGDDGVGEPDRLGQLGRVDDHRPRHAGSLPSDQAV